MPDNKTIKENIISLGFENILKIVLGAIASIQVGRYLGPEAYGKFNFVLSVVLLFSPLLNFPMSEVVIKEVVQEQRGISQVFIEGFRVRLVSGLLGLVLVLISVFNSTSSSEIKVLVVLYALFFLLKAFDITEYIFIAHQNIKSIAYKRTVYFIGINLLKFVLVYLKKDWSWFVYLSCIELMGVFLIYIFSSWNQDWFSQSIWKVDSNFPLFKELIKKSLPFFLITLFSIAYSRVDHLMVWHFLGKKALGEYGVLVKWNEILNFVPLLLTSAFLPKVVEDFGKTNDGYSPNLKLFFKMCFLVSLLIVGFFFFFGSFFISKLYGPKFTQAPLLIKYFCIQISLSFFYVAVVRYLFALNKEFPGILLYGLAFIFNVGLNIYLIPRYELSGAVAASISAYVLSIFISSIFQKELRIGLKKYVTSLI